MSEAVFRQNYPSGRVQRGSKDYGKVFICRRGCNTRTATYTEEFVWEDIHQEGSGLDVLIELVKNQTKAARKRKRDKASEDRAAEVSSNLASWFDIRGIY